MWSLANEPRTQLQDADEYFKQIADHTKALDPTRPVTIALARSVQVLILLALKFIIVLIK